MTRSNASLMDFSHHFPKRLRCNDDQNKMAYRTFDSLTPEFLEEPLHDARSLCRSIASGDEHAYKQIFEMFTVRLLSSCLWLSFEKARSPFNFPGNNLMDNTVIIFFLTTDIFWLSRAGE
jgi:hypothetical protein